MIEDREGRNRRTTGASLQGTIELRSSRTTSAYGAPGASQDPPKDPAPGVLSQDTGAKPQSLTTRNACRIRSIRFHCPQANRVSFADPPAALPAGPGAWLRHALGPTALAAGLRARLRRSSQPRGRGRRAKRRDRPAFAGRA